MFSLDPNILILVLLGIIILLVLWIIRLEVRLNRFMRGKDAHSLEGVFATVAKDIEKLVQSRIETESYLKQVEIRLRRSVQKVHTHRFNPFKGTGSGGNQSFATAFIDEEGNGVIISSLYARDRMNVYAKPIEKFASTVGLSEEEIEVLNKLKGQ